MRAMFGAGLVVALALGGGFEGARAQGAALNGFVDGFSNRGAAGWACAPDPLVDVGVMAFAGPYVVGVYPRTVARPDTEPFCPGTMPAGFSIVFDAAAQAMFTGQRGLSLQAVADGFAPRPLPSSNPVTFDPMPLPTGRLLGLKASQEVAGEIAARGGEPRVELFAGGPVDEGLGMQSGTAEKVAAGHYSLSLPVPGLPASTGPGALLPVFGNTTNVAGVTASLEAPLAVALRDGVPRTGIRVRVGGTVAQAGAISGVTNTVLTSWMPAGTGFAGLTGSVVLSGNDTSFSEALVEVGTTLDTEAACMARNGQMPAGIPMLSRLWAGILKSNDATPVAISVNFALDHVVPATAAGTCLMAWVSAGYPFLSADVPRYTRTAVMLRASVMPVEAGAPAIIPFGMGGEFRSVPGLAQPGGVYVGVMALQPMTVDGIAGTASAAPVAGAPAGTHWDMPGLYWSAAANFMYLPAAACAAAHLHAQPANGPLAVLRNFTPVTFAIPDAAVQVLALPMSSRGAQAIQRSAYVSFPAAGFNGALGVGDCLVAYMSGDTGAAGALDVENQSTVYLRIN
jgi:hypothetical protein